MAPDEPLDSEQQLRHAVRRATPAEAALLPFARDEPVHRDLDTLHGHWRLAPEGLAPARHRGAGRLRGWLLALLAPDLLRQTEHNASTTRLVDYLLRQLETQATVIRELEGRLERHGQPWAYAERPALPDEER